MEWRETRSESPRADSILSQQPLALIPELVTSSERVFRDCLLPNGCIVAAPSHMPYYPKEAKSYLYVWPGRDTGFIIAGMEALGHDVRDPMLRWIIERAEGFHETKLIFEEYHPSGSRRGPEWQPDQAGTLLWALCSAPQPERADEREVVRIAAEGLVEHWDGAMFHRRYRDLWERRYASPRHGSHFTYTLAACAKGLRLAGEVYARDDWTSAGDDMARGVAESVDGQLGRYLRRFGGPQRDDNPDASLLGLAWPFDVVPDDDALARTIETIERELYDDLGVHRYRFDGYDGEVEEAGAEIRQGGGAWPLLTFWLAIVLNRRGRRADALRAFHNALSTVDDLGHFPEMRFSPGDPRRGVRPLLWTHMKFALAAAELGLLPART
jgi:GH15 family glucan-1,4-alpha-glucosidase